MLLFLKIATPFVTYLLGYSIASSRWNRWVVLGFAIVALWTIVLITEQWIALVAGVKNSFAPRKIRTTAAS